MSPWNALYRELTKQRKRLLTKKHVVGCGIGIKEKGGRPTTTPAIMVFVDKKRPVASLTRKERIPELLNGIATDVVEVGNLRLLTSDHDIRTKEMRPARPGISIGHYLVSAGTFGAVAYDGTTGEPLILSNNHVLANSSAGDNARAKEGDPVYQPGTYDGGNAKDTIGHLLRFVPIHAESQPVECTWAHATEWLANRILQTFHRRYRLRFERLAERVNLVDAAVARPIDPKLLDPYIVGLGYIRGVAEIEPGQVIRKSGRSSGVNSGVVRAIRATLNVSLGDAGIAQFDDQIVTTPMAQPGDSGSVGLNEANEIVGLLFAGSAESTIYNRIQHVMELLHIHFNPNARYDRNR